MFRHGTAHTVRRRFLHTPSSCRVGCSVCLGSLVSGRGHPSGRRAVFGASAALLTIGTLLVSPPGRDGAPWREQAVVLAAELSRLGPTEGTAAGALSSELELLGYAPVPRLPAARPGTPPDDDPDTEDGDDTEDSDDGDDGDNTGTDDGDGGTAEPDEDGEQDEDAADPGTDEPATDEETGDEDSGPEDSSAEETGSDETGAEETEETGEAGGTDARADGGAAREPRGSDASGTRPSNSRPSGTGSLGTGWEDAAQELADLLAEFGADDEAAQALADALADAGFDPSGGPGDGGSGDGGSRDTAGGGGEREPGRRAAGGGGGGEVLWDADVETGDLSQFEGGGDDPQQVGAPEPEIVDGRDGDHAVSFTIPGGGNRNEVLPDAEFSDGDERWFGFSSLLEDGFPVDAAWQVIVQWKNDGTGSPPLSLNVENGEYLLHGGYSVGKEWTESIGPATAGEWVDWVVYVEFAGGAGRVDVWQDGEQVVDGLVPDGGTLYPGKDSYLKIGYYRDTGIGEDGTVVFDNWRMGTSYDAVAPGGAAAGSSSGGSTSGESPSGGSSSGGSSDEPASAAPSADRRSVIDDDAATAGTRPRSSVPFVEGR